MDNKEVIKQSVVTQEKGATMVEYALMVALIAVVAIAAVTFLGGQVSGQFSNIGTELENSNENFNPAGGGGFTGN